MLLWFSAASASATLESRQPIRVAGNSSGRILMAISLQSRVVGTEDSSHPTDRSKRPVGTSPAWCQRKCSRYVLPSLRWHSIRNTLVSTGIFVSFVSLN
jgi:hypothetical protein